MFVVFNDNCKFDNNDSCLCRISSLKSWWRGRRSLWWRNARPARQTSAPQTRKPVGAAKANPGERKRRRRYRQHLPDHLYLFIFFRLLKMWLVLYVCHLSQLYQSWVQSCQSWWCTPEVFPLKASNSRPKARQPTCRLSLKVKHSGMWRTQVCVYMIKPTFLKKS